ncbi:MAG TPA: HU family DNA-binding protein [Aggregatilineales bacterium]|nr:HU family DNA-binding protein [Aggregatilineales bacterium]
MNQRQLVRRVARRLPFTTQREVEEIITLMGEGWQEALLRGERVLLPGIGSLSLEVQQMQRGGVMHRRGTSPILKRVYGRFRPSAALKGRIEEAADEA